VAKVEANSIYLDSQSLEAVDGSRNHDEVLQVKLDPAGGILRGASGLTTVGGSVSVGPQGFLTFSWMLIPANLTSQGVYVAGADLTQVTMAEEGSLVGLSVRLINGPITAGGTDCIAVTPRISGSSVGAMKVGFDSATPTIEEYITATEGTHTFSAGDELGLLLTTTSGLLPADTMSLVAVLSTSPIT